MADLVFNIAKGRINELQRRVATNDPADSVLVVVLLKTAEADATLEDYETLSALLVNSDEADFTGYGRKVLTDADVPMPVVDHTANTQSSDIPDQVWISAGGTLDNALAKAVVCYDPAAGTGTDSELVPLSAADFVATTNGNNLTGIMHADGYFRAS